MHYEGVVIRPPSEADSIILQVAVGCAHNRCTFCGAYKGVRFRIKGPAALARDLDFAAAYCTRQRRVFLADGDVLLLPGRRLKEILLAVRSRLPWVRRVSLYGSARAIRVKSAEELAELRSLGLDRVYMGLESGHAPTLERIRKGSDAGAMLEAGLKVRAAGLFLSVTVLLGIGGEKDSQAHALDTARLLNAMAPSQIAVLSLMVLPDTPLHEDLLAGRFRLPREEDLLAELRTMVSHLDLERTQFHANHASNPLPLSGRLPRDKPALLGLVDRAISGKVPLVPGHLRRL